MSADHRDYAADARRDGIAAETELKFAAGPADLRRLAKHPLFAAAPKVARVTSVYYDTPDFDLHKGKVSLRVRRAGGRYVQTVKQIRSGDVFDRDEWETPVRRPAVDLNLLADTPAAALAAKAGAPLAPVFRTRFTRQTRMVVHQGAAIEIAVDKGRVLAGATSMPLAELEMELKSGEASALYDLARELFALAPIRLSLTSKSERGYRLLSQGVASKASKIGLNADMTVGEAFSAIAHACLVQVVEAADAYRQAAGPEPIHKLRVGLRRLRTAIRIFDDAIVDPRAAFIDAEARWLAGEVAPARSLDVFIAESFEPNGKGLSDPDAAARYGVRLHAARKAAHARAAAALGTPRFSALALETALWIEDGDWRHPKTAARIKALDGGIGPYSALLLERLRHGVLKRAKGLEKLDPEARHKLRIRAKRLRYAAEFFCLLYDEDDGPKRQRRFIAALKPLQAALGRLNDIAMAPEAAMTPLGKRPAPRLVFIAGELVGRLQQPAARQLTAAVAAAKDLKDAKRFWSKPKDDEPQRHAPD